MNSRFLMETGVSGLAVSSSIILAQDINQESRKIANQICFSHCERLKKKITANLESLRHQKPIVFHITNNVVMNQSANFTLAIGGSPIMASEPKEMTEIVKISNALLLNIGTLTETTLASMLVAGIAANELGKPIILDPVGVGASHFRFESVQRLLTELKIAIIKGNSSEIETLFRNNLSKQQRGVDGSETDYSPEMMVRKLAEKTGSVVALTGFHDYVSDGKSVIILRNNCQYLPKITGSGCVAGSLIGAFAGVERDYLTASCGGILSLTCASEMSEKEGSVKGPMSFFIALGDQLSFLDGARLGRQMTLNKLR